MQENSDNTDIEEKKEVAQEVLDDIKKDVAEQETKEIAPEEEKPVEESPEEINWRKFREGRAQDRKQKEESDRAVREKEEQVRVLTQALEHASNSKGANLTEKETKQVIHDLVDDDILTGAEVKSFLNSYVPQEVEKILRKQEDERNQKEASRAQKEMPKRLVQEHKDFSEVVNQENLDYLDYHYPEIAGAFASLPESFDKWSKVYKAVKKLIPTQGKSDVNRIEKNMSKPQSAAHVSNPVNNEAGYGRQLGEEQKKQNYQRLIELASGI